MADHLRVRILLNKGKRSVSLRRLPIILQEIRKFLELLATDTVGVAGDWFGEEFKSTSSLEYTALSSTLVDADRSTAFDASLRSVVQRKPDPSLRQSTLAQYDRVAKPLEGESVAFGIDDFIEAEGKQNKKFEWIDVGRDSNEPLAGIHSALVKSHGSVQGVMHSLFMGADPPYFKLRELSTDKLITCQYERQKYNDIVGALQLENAVLHVYGLIYTNLAESAIDRLSVFSIEISRVLRRDDLNRFTGSLPTILGDTSLQNLFDEMRDRERQ